MSRRFPFLVLLLPVVLAVAPAPAQDDLFPTDVTVDRGPVDRVATRHLPEDFPLLPVPAKNPLTEAKIELGERLFFEPGLSADGTISCASCHRPERYFADSVPLSKGVGGVLGPRNAPTVLNTAYYPRLLGDGRSFDLEDQVRYPITHEKEMQTTPEAAVAFLTGHPQYPNLFAEAFGDAEITFARVSEALASFERTLFSGDSPFDRFYFQGDSTTFSPAARRGWVLFQSKARCITCHRFSAESPFFTDDDYHNTGISWDTKTPDLGRYTVTKARDDKGRHRTPPLRDVEMTAPYMHDGRFTTLEEVVDFYRQGCIDNYFLDEKIEPVELGDGEKADLIEFLKSLTGRMSYPPDGRGSDRPDFLTENRAAAQPRQDGEKP